MTTTFKRPGAFIQEVALTQQIPSLGLDAAVGVFVGAAERGSATAAQFTASWSEFTRLYGGLKKADGTIYPTAYAAYQFFSNGGRGCWINRVTSSSAYAATATFSDGWTSPTNVLTVNASSPGDWALATATSGVALVFEYQTLVSAIQTASRDSNNILTIVTSQVNTIKVGDIVAISGLTTTGFNTETAVLTVGSDGKTFTVSSTGSSATEGSPTTPTSGIVTPSQRRFGVSVLLGGTVNGYLVEKFNDLSMNPADGRYAVTVINNNSQYVVASVPSGFVAPVVGGVSVYHAPSDYNGVAQGLGRPTIQVVTNNVQNISAATWATNVSTITTTATHNFVVGNTVSIVGITATSGAALFNGTWTIASVPTGTTFTFASPGTAPSGVVVTGATATVSTTTPTLVTGSLNGTALTASDLNAAVSGLGPLTPNLVVNVPDATLLSQADMKSVYTTYLGAVDARNDSFLVMDTPSGLMPSEAISFAADVTPKSSNGAIYYPWVTIPDPSATTSGATRNVAPGGSVVGLYLATDAARGSWKAPAGTNVRVVNAVALERTLLSGDLDALNTALTPVNALRPIVGSGICVMGARTISNDSSYRYVSTRRSMLQIKKRLLDVTQFAVFEGNDARLWERLRTVCTTYLNGVWQSGGLKGAKASDAFYVICDATNNSPASVASGQVMVEVGVALEVPAEFVIITIGQVDGTATATVQG